MLKKLVVFPSDPMDAYIEKGFSYDHLADYYNPGDYFDEVYCLSPWKSTRETFGKIRCIQARPSQFRKIIKRIKPDVVRGFGGYCCADWAAISKVKGIPTVVSLHDTNPDLIHDSVRYADTIICMSKAVKEAAIKLLNLPDKNIWVMPNRIDVDLFSYKEPNEKAAELNARFGNCKHILHVGRKSREKNLDTLIKAMPHLDDTYRAVFVGRGDVAPYQKLAEKCGVEDRCYFIESVPNDELPYWFSWCDCMCTPSRWEGFGIVFIEAASCETAIVTSNTGAMNEYLNHDNAILVDDFENPIAIADAILKAVEGNPDEIQRIRRNARKVGLRFSKEAVDRQEIEIYKQAMQMDLTDQKPRPIKYAWESNWKEKRDLVRQSLIERIPVNSPVRKAYRMLKSAVRTIIKQ